MKEIVVIPKPENISWEEIRNVIHQAHKSNFEKGIVMRTTTFTAEELKERVGPMGKCFVAMDGDQVIGTTSCCVGEVNHWFYHGRIMKWMLLGILPMYKGFNICTMLLQKVEEETKLQGCTTISFDTAEENTNMQKICLKKGFVYVDFIAFPLSNHYSVEMLKWLDGCPFSKIYCFLRFNLKKYYIKLRFKPRRTKRFGV